MIELVLLVCGMFWKPVTSIYRIDTVGDFCDIIACLPGGLLYWIIIKNIWQQAGLYIWQRRMRKKRQQQNDVITSAHQCLFHTFHQSAHNLHHAFEPIQF